MTDPINHAMDYEFEMEKALSMILINLKGIQESKTAKQRSKFKVDISSDYGKSEVESSPVESGRELTCHCSRSESTFTTPQQEKSIVYVSMVPSLVEQKLSENVTSHKNTPTPQTKKRSRKLPKAPVTSRWMPILHYCTIQQAYQLDFTLLLLPELELESSESTVSDKLSIISCA